MRCALGREDGGTPTRPTTLLANGFSISSAVHGGLRSGPVRVSVGRAMDSGYARAYGWAVVAETVT